MKAAQRTITLGDGDSNDAQSHLVSIPARWRKDEKSPLYRHLDGANYAFADGHVKYIRADAWKSGLEGTQGFSSSPKKSK